MAASQGAALETRPLTTIAEFEEAVELQKTIWGFADIELLPRRLFVVANKVGGQTMGAFDGARMVAFLIAIPGLKPGGKYYLHSHMLGTLAQYRDRGLGKRLKLMQRDDAIQRGIQLIEWTFDPMELKNAFFNIERLGAVVRRYVPNQYGTTSSHLHGGLPTDRCVAEWYINTPRVHAIVGKQPYQRPASVEKIAVPADIADIRKQNPARAKEVQDGLREQFLRHFRNGLEVTGFAATETEGIYLLSEMESK